jgi:hypothetical protein
MRRNWCQSGGRPEPLIPPYTRTSRRFKADCKDRSVFNSAIAFLKLKICRKMSLLTFCFFGDLSTFFFAFDTVVQKRAHAFAYSCRQLAEACQRWRLGRVDQHRAFAWRLGYGQRATTRPPPLWLDHLFNVCRPNGGPCPLSIGLH